MHTFSRPLTVQRMDAILALLRKGMRDIYEIAEHVSLIPEQTRVRYLKVLIAEGKAHISHAVKRKGTRSGTPFPIYAFGPPPDDVPRDYGAQYTRARLAIRTGSFLPATLAPILHALSDGEKDLSEIAEETGFHLANIKRRVDSLIDDGLAHVVDRERRGRYPQFLYALGPAPKALPRTAKMQYAYWRRKYAKASQEVKAERRRALYVRSTPDVAARWMVRPTNHQLSIHA